MISVEITCDRYFIIYKVLGTVHAATRTDVARFDLAEQDGQLRKGARSGITGCRRCGG